MTNDGEAARWAALENYVVARGGDVGLWTRAAELVRAVHGPQRRNNGRPFVAHLLDVATLLTEWGSEPLVVMAGLLHDLSGPGALEADRIADALQQPELLTLLDVSDRLHRHALLVPYARANSHLQALFDLMLADVRAALVRSAERLADLHEADAFRDEQHELLLVSSHESFLPLVERLGMWEVRSQMESRLLALRNPERYAALERWRTSQEIAQQPAIEEWRAALRVGLAKAGLGQAVAEPEIILRHTASIERQAQAQRSGGRLDLAKLDARHLYITYLLCESVESAFLALRAAHLCGSPVNNSFRDYFAQPKDNGYAALHTSIIFQNVPQQLRLTTKRLFPLARGGILTPVAYAALQGEPLPDDWQSDEQHALEHFLRSIRRRRPDRMALFTPTGELRQLPEGATVLDFAYDIHTEVGKEARSAFVNGQMVRLDRELTTGDVVEIIRDQTREWPEAEALDWARTPKARDAIQQQLRQRPEQRGRTLLDRELRQRSRKVDDYLPRLATLADEIGSSLDELFRGVARGTWKANDLVDRLLRGTPSPNTTAIHHVEPAPDVAHRFPQWHPSLVKAAECCAPVVGDPIVGLSLAHGTIEMHHADCPQLPATPTSAYELLPLQWRTTRVEVQRVTLLLRAANRKGLIHDITQMVRHANVDIFYLEGRRITGDMDEVTVTLDMANELELAHLVDSFRRLPSITLVTVDGHEAEEAVIALQRHFAPPNAIPLPYSPGRPVGGNGFWGREREMQLLENLLNSTHGVSVLLQGPRRIGKTSLMNHLGTRKTIRDSHLYVYVDLQSAAQSSEAEVLRLIARRLIKLFDEAQRPPLPTLAQLLEAPHLRFMEFIEALSELNRGFPKRIILALDEFDTLVGAVESGVLDPRIFGLLRSLIQHSELLTLLICTSDDVAALLQQRNVIEVLNVLSSLSLPVLDREAAQSLLQEPLRGQVYFAPEAVSALLHTTGCHPYYLQILGASLITMLNRNEHRYVYESHVTALIERHTQLNGSEFRHLWEEQDEAQWLALRALGTPPFPLADNGHPVTLLQQRLNEAGLPITFERLAGALDRMVERETLVRTSASDGSLSYRFAVPLFRHWLATNHPLHHKRPAG